MNGWSLLEKDRYGARRLEAREGGSPPVEVWIDEEGRLCIKGNQISRERRASRSVVETLYRAHDVRQAHAFLRKCPHPEPREVGRLMAEVCSLCNGIRRKETPDGPFGPWELENEGILRPAGWLREKADWPGPPELPEGWSDPDHPNFDETATLNADAGYVPDVLEDDESIKGMVETLVKGFREIESRPFQKVNCPGCGRSWKSSPGSIFECLVCHHEIMVPNLAMVPTLETLETYVPETHAEALEQGRFTHVDCEPHEWNGRSRVENVRWMIETLQAELGQRG